MFGPSPLAYFLRNLRAVTWCPTTDIQLQFFCNWIAVIGHLRCACGALKDVRANCLCASLLRTQFMLRHARARAKEDI